MLRLTVFAISVVLLFVVINAGNSASAENIARPDDSTAIAKGEASFNQLCSGCHNFRQDAIGPQLGGLTKKVTSEWIKLFITNPQKMISSGDKRALEMVKKFKVVMPSFTTLTNDELNAIITFLHTRKLPDQRALNEKSGNILNPVPEAIKPSNTVAALKLVTHFPPSDENGKSPLARITKLDFEPKTGSSFIVDLRGKLYKMVQNKPLVYMDMAVLKPKFIDRPGLGSGFGSFAFHPAFSDNGLLYTTHTESRGSSKADFYYADSIKVTLQWVLTEWKCDNPAAPVFSGTGRELLRVNMVAPNHGVQEITFNPFATPGAEDYGLLYIGVGDGGSVEQGFPFLAHSTEKIWGTILRIDPTGRNSTNGNYGIPELNPFTKETNPRVLKEIYAIGFRNPHRITWTTTKQMIATNIGHGNIESLNIIQKGHDYGWPQREGTFAVDPGGQLNKVYPLPANDSSFHFTYPIAQYDHDEGNAISGGFEYTGKVIPGLKGKFLFGDIPSGKLFYIDIADIKPAQKKTLAAIKEWKIIVDGTPTTLKDLCNCKRVDLHFGRDSQGELYLLTKADGKMYKIVER